MTSINLSGKRVLVLGAETQLGGAIATAIAEAGAAVAAVSSKSDAEAAFAAQRLARRLSSSGNKVISQAIDATNEKAVQVMMRQVAKELGGLDAVVACWLLRIEPGAEPSGITENLQNNAIMMNLAMRHGAKELEKAEGGRFVLVTPGRAGGYLYAKPETPVARPGWKLISIGQERKPLETIALETVRAVAGTSE